VEKNVNVKQENIDVKLYLSFINFSLISFTPFLISNADY
jgi:hypothetical protein